MGQIKVIKDIDEIKGCVIETAIHGDSCGYYKDAFRFFEISEESFKK